MKEIKAKGYISKTMRKIKDILLYIWQAPQSLLGLLFRVIYKNNNSEYNDAIVRKPAKMQGGISLGRYISINQWATDKTVMHEYEHCIQSRKLGWFYLLLD